MEETFGEFTDRMNRLINNPTLGDCDHAIREGRALIQAALQVGVPEDAEPEFMEAAVDVLVTVGFGVAYFQRMRETLVDTTIADMERDLNN